LCFIPKINHAKPVLEILSAFRAICESYPARHAKDPKSVTKTAAEKPFDCKPEAQETLLLQVISSSFKFLRAGKQAKDSYKNSTPSDS
jgi:hypothetical protein